MTYRWIISNIKHWLYFIIAITTMSVQECMTVVLLPSVCKLLDVCEEVKHLTGLSCAQLFQVTVHYALPSSSFSQLHFLLAVLFLPYHISFSPPPFPPLIFDELCASFDSLPHPFLPFLSFFQPLSSYHHLFLDPRVAGRGGAWKHGSVSGLQGEKGAGWCVCICVWVCFGSPSCYTKSLCTRQTLPQKVIRIKM